MIVSSGLQKDLRKVESLPSPLYFITIISALSALPSSLKLYYLFLKHKQWHLLVLTVLLN